MILLLFSTGVILENLVPLPKGNRAIECKWIYKMNDDERYKARLVAKEFAQRTKREYDEIFAQLCAILLSGYYLL